MKGREEQENHRGDDPSPFADATTNSETRIVDRLHRQVRLFVEPHLSRKLERVCQCKGHGHGHQRDCDHLKNEEHIHLPRRNASLEYCGTRTAYIYVVYAVKPSRPSPSDPSEHSSKDAKARIFTAHSEPTPSHHRSADIARSRGREAFQHPSTSGAPRRHTDGGVQPRQQ